MPKTYKISIPEIAPTGYSEVVEIINSPLVLDTSDSTHRSWRVLRDGNPVGHYLSPGQYGPTYSAFIVHNGTVILPNVVTLQGGSETIVVPSGTPTGMSYRFDYQTGVVTFDVTPDPVGIYTLNAYRPRFLGTGGGSGDGGTTVIEQNITYVTNVTENGTGSNHEIISGLHLDTTGVPFDGALLTYRGSTGLKVGTYIGNGGTQEVTNIGFRPSFLMLKGIGGDANHAHTLVKTDTMPLTENIVNGTDNDAIPAVSDDGFTVHHLPAEINGWANELGTTYHYLAAGGNSVITGSYVGSGTPRTINTGGRPKLVYVISEADGSLHMRTPEMALDSYEITFDSGGTTRILNLNDTGFDLGSSGEVNGAGNTYHYVSWQGDNVASGTYIADYEYTSPHTQPPTALPFDIAQVITRTGEGASQIATYRQTTNPDGSMSFSGIATEQPSRILSMADRQIIFGTNAEVDNNAGIRHYWWAFGESLPQASAWVPELLTINNYKPISHWDYIVDATYKGASGTTVTTENGRDVLMYKDFQPAILHANQYRTGVNDEIAIKVHPGVYTVTTALPINSFSGGVYIEGPGGIYTTYAGQPLYSQALIQVTASANGLKCEGNEFVSFRGLSFQADGSATMISFNFPSWGFIDNCYFGSGGAVSVYMTTGSGVTGRSITNSTFGYSAAPIFLDGATELYIDHCQFWSSGSDIKIKNSDIIGISNSIFHGYLQFTAQASNNVHITDNLFNANLPSDAIRFDNGGGVTSMSITGNTFYLPNPSDGIDFSGATNYCLSVTITGNTFYKLGSSGNIAIRGNTEMVRNSLVSNNTFYGFTSNTLALFNWEGPGNEAMHNILSDGTTKIVMPDIGSPVGHGGSVAPADHDHTTGGDGGILTNSLFDGYAGFGEISHPGSTPAANNLWLYGADDGGLTKLYYKLQNGTTVGPLGSGGSADSLQTAYNAGNTITASSGAVWLNRTTGSDIVFSVSTVGAANQRFGIDASGALLWGPGTHAAENYDVFIFRNAPGNFRIDASGSQASSLEVEQLRGHGDTSAIRLPSGFAFENTSDITLTSDSAVTLNAGMQKVSTLGGTGTIITINAYSGQVAIIRANGNPVVIKHNDGAGNVRTLNGVDYTMTADGSDFFLAFKDFDWNKVFVAPMKAETPHYTVNFVIDGGTSVVTSGIKGWAEIPSNGYIEEWRVIGDVAGDFGVVCTTCSYANLPTFGAFSPALIPATGGAQYNQATGIATTVAVNTETLVRFEVTGTPTNIKKATVALKVRRT